MTRRKRIDANQREIVRDLRMVGVFIEPKLARVGDGCPDVLWRYRGRWGVAEIKRPGEDLTSSEWDWWFRSGLLSEGQKPIVWRSLDDARKTLGL